MMSRTVGFVGVLVLAAVLVVAVGTAAAQTVTDPVPPAPVPVVPQQCYVPEYDLNGDGRVNEVDMNQWKRWFLGEECQQGAGTCEEGMDINGDGEITFDDLNVMLDHYRVCVTLPRPNDLPPR